MLRQLRPAFVMVALFTVITGLIYPLGMTGIAQLLFNRQADGSLIEHNGKVVGSEFIGQNFASPRYFHGRPSATTGPDPKDPASAVPTPYNAENSGGSNLAPTSKSLIDNVSRRAKILREENPEALVPVDLVTTSASGLDPDISPAAALFQIPRVAKARDLSEYRLRQLVIDNTADRTFGVLGEPRVNVLKLNLALDAIHPANAH